jgi:hypothetical protein
MADSCSSHQLQLLIEEVEPVRAKVKELGLILSRHAHCNRFQRLLRYSGS